MANAVYTRSYGVPAPGAPKGSYPVTTAELIQGGLHAASNESDMTQILPQFRELGMECYVLSTQKKYRLINNPDSDYTALKDWKYIPDAITNEELNKLVTDSELDELILKLQNNIKTNYLSKAEAKQNYLDAITLSKYYQSIDGMKNYITVDALQRILVALSKSVSRVIPLDILRVVQGTTISSLYLPTSVTVYYNDGNYGVVPVNWNWQTYDPDLVGYQIIEGRMFLPDYIDIESTPNVQTVQQIIQVLGKTEEIVEPITYSDIAGFEELSNILVDIATEVRSLNLPEQITVKLVNEEAEVYYRHMQVRWDYEQFDYNKIQCGVVIPGDVVITDNDHVTNTLKLRPKIVVKTMSSNISPTYQYKRGTILEAGKSELVSDLVNRIDHVYTTDFYGCGNDVSQRLVDIRFTGLVNDEGINLTPEILEQYPEGIRMPVLTSPDEDVEAFLDVIRSFNSTLGYQLEYEIPGGITNPRVCLDDETHRILFGSAVMHRCSFLIRRSATVNLLYPDIC